MKTDINTYTYGQTFLYCSLIAHFVNPKDLPEGTTIVDKLIEMTDGGCDFTFDATGNVEVMRSALEACHKGWGVCNVIGVAPAGAEIKTRP